MSKLYVNEVHSKTGSTKALEIDNNGVIKQSALPTFKVHGGSGSGSKLDLTSATWTSVPYGTAEWNVGSHFDTANSRFKPTVGGYWYLQADGYMTYGSDAPSQRRLAFFDDSGNELLRSQLLTNDSSGYGTVPVSGIFNMTGNGTDWIEVKVFVGDCNDGDFYYGQLHGGFQGYFIG